MHFPPLGTVALARDALPPLARPWFKTEHYALVHANDSRHAVGDFVQAACIDATYEFNDWEQKFAQALDLADFVVWWHRNPDRKPYSVGLLRADSHRLFYPDFVICMHHMPDEAPLMRLVDPKHDTTDAARKALHHSRFYGKVLFLTKVGESFKIVNDNGSVGSRVDFDDLGRLKAWMRSHSPGEQSANAGLID
jgi:hypothetical protein